MKRLILLIPIITLAIGLVFSNVDAAVKVKGYYRKDGTYVQPHYRSNPNSTKLDNYSTKGNINPYTGKIGTIDPYKFYSLPKIKTFVDGSQLNLETNEIVNPSQLVIPIGQKFCNQKLWLDCSNGDEFYCPVIGDPVCKPKIKQESQKICNGKIWLDCIDGKKFYCPITGDPVCLAPTKDTTNSETSKFNDWSQRWNQKWQECEKIQGSNLYLQGESLSKWRKCLIELETIVLN